MNTYIFKPYIYVYMVGVQRTIARAAVTSGEPSIPTVNVCSLPVVCVVQGSGCRVQGAGCRVRGSGFRIQGSGFRGQGSTCRAASSQK